MILTSIFSAGGFSYHGFCLKLIGNDSSGNAFLFNGSRTLHGIALDGFAPSFIRQTNRNGVPWVAVTITLIVGCLSFLQVNKNTSKVLDW
jgi:amino acid transporter